MIMIYLLSGLIVNNLFNEAHKLITNLKNNDSIILCVHYRLHVISVTFCSHLQQLLIIYIRFSNTNYFEWNISSVQLLT